MLEFSYIHKPPEIWCRSAIVSPRPPKDHVISTAGSADGPTLFTTDQTSSRDMMIIC